MSRKDNIYVLLTFAILILGCMFIYSRSSYRFEDAEQYESQLKAESEHVSIAESAKSEIASAQQETTKYVETTVVDVVPIRQQESIHIDGVKLNSKLQSWIFEYCDTKKISPCLVLAIIEQESECDPDCTYITETEESVGLMQIQEKWHRDRMDRLGVTDLTDPYQNIQTGIDYLLELFETKPEVEWVLNAYNGGKAYADKMQEKKIDTDYSQKILRRATELERNLYGQNE